MLVKQSPLLDQAAQEKNGLLCEKKIKHGAACILGNGAIYFSPTQPCQLEVEDAFLMCKGDKIASPVISKASGYLKAVLPKMSNKELESHTFNNPLNS